MSWSEPGARFNGHLIREVHSQAYQGVCPCCKGETSPINNGRKKIRLSLIAGGIIVCMSCGVAFHAASERMSWGAN